MGIPVLVMGQSGSGKSTSLRNFNENEIGVLNVAGKPLPFRKKLQIIDNADYQKIIKVLSRPTLKTYVIDDSQYLMAFSMFSRARETGYSKFTDIAVDFTNLVKFILERTPKDVIVYFLHHTEVDEQGRTKAKTIGKMLDNQITLEGLFSIVLLAYSRDGRYYFLTQNDGASTVKTPMEMFNDKVIDNDLKAVDSVIREYWGLTTEEKEDDTQRIEQQGV